MDVTQFTEFYATPLGHEVVPRLREIILKIWPDLKNYRVLAIGYPIPYIIPYYSQPNYFAVVMPAYQNAHRWPVNHPNLTVLTDEAELPFADCQFDRILMIHALEHSLHTNRFLKEACRVLAPQGKVLAITPNRRGIWAHIGHTPMGQGRPYTLTQLRDILYQHGFTPIQAKRGLYIYPSSSKILTNLRSGILESLASCTLQKFSGIVCVEAEKLIFKPINQGRKIRVRLPAILGPEPISAC